MDSLSLGIIIGIITFFGLVLVLIYNTLVRKKNQVEFAFSGIHVQLKKRYDLIPNLVATVQGYMKHEREVLEKLTSLRSQALACRNQEEQVQLNNQIQHAMGNIMLAVENYPALRASQTVDTLMRSLNEVEEQLSAARRAYNAAATAYNNAIEMVPMNMIANTLGYRRRAVFEAPSVAQESVNVAALLRS